MLADTILLGLSVSRLTTPRLSVHADSYIIEARFAGRCPIQSGNEVNINVADMWESHMSATLIFTIALLGSVICQWLQILCYGCVSWLRRIALLHESR